MAVVGEMLVSVGAGAALLTTWNALASVEVPLAVVTDTSRGPVVAPAAIVISATT